MRPENMHFPPIIPVLVLTAHRCSSEVHTAEQMRRHDRQLERELARIPADQRQGPQKFNIPTWMHIITSTTGAGKIHKIRVRQESSRFSSVKHHDPVT
jgi:hypothetical protein